MTGAAIPSPASPAARLDRRTLAWVAVLYIAQGLPYGVAHKIWLVYFRAHGVWHVWPTLVVAGIGLLALGASLYTVYLLEIVKLAGPRARRREQEARARRTA